MTPPLECPSCRGTTWLRGDAEDAPVCERCGSAVAPLPRGLVSALRRRFARDARASRGQPRFVREKP